MSLACQSSRQPAPACRSFLRLANNLIVRRHPIPPHSLAPLDTFSRWQNRLRQDRRSLEIAWVTSDLAISRAPAPDEWQLVSAEGIDSVADLRAGERVDAELVERHGLRYASFPVEDGAAPSPGGLRRLAGWVADEIEAGRAVLIHCREGRGRSVLAAGAALRELGYGVANAYALVRRAQTGATLSEVQIAALAAYRPRKR